MKIEFKNNTCFSNIPDILIRKDNGALKIFYGSNGDLYIDIYGSYNLDGNGNYTADFYIDKNEKGYEYFEILINNIINCNVLNVSEIELMLCSDQDQVKELLNSNKAYKEKLKSSDVYHRLVQDTTITWYSDNIYDDKANKMTIEKNNNKIKLTFTDNPEDPTFGFGIRISNSGSKYDPFNLCFMMLFNQLCSLNQVDKQKTLVPKKIN